MKLSSAWMLKLRLWLATVFLFGLLYAIITAIGYYFGYGGPLLFVGFAFIIIVAQYLAGPKIVEVTMKVRYVSKEELTENKQLFLQITQIYVNRPSFNDYIKEYKVKVSKDLINRMKTQLRGGKNNKVNTGMKMKI